MGSWTPCWSFPPHAVRHSVDLLFHEVYRVLPVLVCAMAFQESSKQETRRGCRKDRGELGQWSEGKLDGYQHQSKYQQASHRLLQPVVVCWLLVLCVHSVCYYVRKQLRLRKQPVNDVDVHHHGRSSRVLHVPLVHADEQELEVSLGNLQESEHLARQNELKWLNSQLKFELF